MGIKNIELTNNHYDTNASTKKTYVLHKHSILKDEKEFLWQPQNHISGIEDVVDPIHINASCFANDKISASHNLHRTIAIACPLCRRYLLNRNIALYSTHHEKVNLNLTNHAAESAMSTMSKPIQHSFSDEDCLHRIETDENIKFGSSSKIDNGNIMNPHDLNEVCVEGWLFKKGSGKDWLGDTKFKSRWARLIVSISIYSHTI